MPGNRRADLEKIAAAAGAAKARDRSSRARSKRQPASHPDAVAPFPLPADRRRSWSTAPCSAHEAVWIGAGSPSHLAVLPPAELVRLARAVPMDAVQDPAYDSRFERRRLMRETETIWMNGEFIDWADAKVHVGTHGPALRHRRVRGDPLLRDAGRPGRLPAARAPEAARELGTAALHGPAVHGRRAPHGHARADRPQRAARVLPAAVRVLRLRRARRAHEGQPGRGRDHELAVGQLPRRRQPGGRHSRDGLLLEARRREHDPARRQGDRRLPQLDARRARGAALRLRRGDPAHGRGLRRRRLGRERLRRQGRRASGRRRSRPRSCPASRATA